MNDSESEYLALLLLILLVIAGVWALPVKAEPPVMDHHPCRAVYYNMERIGSFSQKEIHKMVDTCMRRHGLKKEARQALFNPEYREDWANLSFEIGKEGGTSP